MTSPASEPRRGGGRGLDRSLVLHTALDIVDAEGLEALTMRRLARELDVEAMSLYNHVQNKQDLREGIVDLVLAEIDVPPVGELDSRDYAGLLAHNLRAALLRHPNVAPEIGAAHLDPEATPAGARLFNAAIANASRGGYSDDAIRRSIHLMMMVALGWAILEARSEAAEMPDSDEEEDADSGLDYASFFDMDMDEQFRLAMEITLDGIERHWLGSSAPDS